MKNGPAKQFIRWMAAFLFLPFLSPGLASAVEPALTRSLERLDPPEAAPPFQLPDMDGKVHRLADYRGKAVILNFWATWCPPCRKEMPSMERAWRKLQARGVPVVLVAVNVGEDEEVIFAFTAQMDLTFPILLDRKSEVAGRYPMVALPTTFVIDPEGRLVYRAVGGREWDDDALLDSVIALTGERKVAAPTATDSAR